MTKPCRYCSDPCPESLGTKPREFCSQSHKTLYYRQRRERRRRAFLSETRARVTAADWVGLAAAIATDERAALFSPDIMAAIRRLAELAAEPEDVAAG